MKTKYVRLLAPTQSAIAHLFSGIAVSFDGDGSWKFHSPGFEAIKTLGDFVERSLRLNSLTPAAYSVVSCFSLSTFDMKSGFSFTSSAKNCIS